MAAGKADERQRRNRPAEKRRHGKRIDAERLQDRRRDAVAERYRRDCGECGTRGHADQPRIGERVAEQPLHHGAGNREACAYEDGEERARQTNVDKHELLACRRRIVFAAEPGGDDARQRGERDARRTDRER